MGMVFWRVVKRMSFDKVGLVSIFDLGIPRVASRTYFCFEQSILSI